MAQDSTSALQASGKTGGTCKQTGPYRSSRNAKAIVFVRKGHQFPPDTDGAATTWTLVSG